MFNILEGFDLKAMGHNSADYIHVHTEAKKLAFEDRARFYADQDFYPTPLKHLLSKKYRKKCCYHFGRKAPPLPLLSKKSFVIILGKVPSTYYVRLI